MLIKLDITVSYSSIWDGYGRYGLLWRGRWLLTYKHCFWEISTEWKDYDIENTVAAENKPSSFGKGSATRF